MGFPRSSPVSPISSHQHFPIFNPLPSPCHFIFSFIHFMPSFTPFTVRKNSSALDHSILLSWWTKRCPCRCFGFISFPSTTNFTPPCLHSHRINFVSFHFIRSCAGAKGVVGRHPCYSLTFNIGASSYPIPRPDHVSDTG